MSLDFDTLDRARAGLAEANYHPYDQFSDEQIRSGLKKLQEGLLKSKKSYALIREYIAHLKTPMPQNTQGWMALAEKLFAALGVAELGLRGETDSMVPAEKWVSVKDAIMVFSRLLPATPYLWLNQIDNMVRESPLPRHVIGRDLLPEPFMFWSRQTAFPVSGSEIPDDTFESNWTLVTDEESAVVVVNDLISVRPGDSFNITSWSIPYGKTFPDDFKEEGGERQSVEYILQCLAFLSSPYTTTERSGIPRSIRRRAGLEREEEPEDIRTVILRRAVGKMGRRPPAEQQDVDWQHHWWVKGHYRAQWRPSVKTHRVTWIAPYIKGPLDKPLLEKVYKVAR
jgi:hypothetical protein